MFMANFIASYSYRIGLLATPHCILCGVFLAPQLCKKFPNHDVTLGISVAEYPTLNVTSQYASLFGKINLLLYITDGRSAQEEIAFILQFVSSYTEPVYLYTVITADYIIRMQKQTWTRISTIQITTSAPTSATESMTSHAGFDVHITLAFSFRVSDLHTVKSYVGNLSVRQT